MTLRSRRVPRMPRSQYRQLRRESDGTLYDVNERRRISSVEVRDDIQAGRRFRAVHHDTGVDCTSQVLAEALKGALVDKVGFGTGLPAGLATIAGSLLSALDNRNEGQVGPDHRGARMNGPTIVPAQDNEPWNPGRG